MLEWFKARARIANSPEPNVVKLVTVNSPSRSIFISYRRSDEQNFAGRIYEKLARQYGDESVFMDVSSIGLGADFSFVIEESLNNCKVAIVVIGKRWLSAEDSSGRRRIDSPNDYVRLEVEIALKRGVYVIPVLVDGATMPDETNVPQSIAELTYRRAHEMTHTNFRADSEALISAIDKVVRFV